MFVIFYTVNLYIYDLFHILLSSWHAEATWSVYVSFKLTT